MKKKKKTSTIQVIRNVATELLRRTTSGRRALPQFIIIGAAKGGTTSLFNYLIQHPKIHAPLKKEIHYFDHHYNKGLNWYKLHFPSVSSMKEGEITGEASPYYLSHPRSPIRLHQLLPGIKMIVLLRNPIDRALSNYQHMKRLGIEKETFEKAIELEPERTNGEELKLLENDGYYSFSHHHYSYLGRGIYYRELERWFALFPREQFLILNSESFYQNPSTTLAETLKFLGMPEWSPASFKAFNTGGDYDEISEEMRMKLSSYFKEPNEKLYKLIGKKFDWD